MKESTTETEAEFLSRITVEIDYDGDDLDGALGQIPDGFMITMAGDHPAWRSPEGRFYVVLDDPWRLTEVYPDGTRMAWDFWLSRPVLTWDPAGESSDFTSLVHMKADGTMHLHVPVSQGKTSLGPGGVLATACDCEPCACPEPAPGFPGHCECGGVLR